MKKFTNETMHTILSVLKQELENKSKIQIEVLNPSKFIDLYDGEKVVYENTQYIYRSYKTYCDLAEVLYCKFNILEINNYTVLLEYLKLDKNSSFHLEHNTTEKYGIESIFSKINKNEEPNFLNTYENTLKNVNIKNRKNVLNLGINKADEFEVIKNILSKEDFENINFYGVDFSESAILYAKKRFPNKNFNFYCEDINNLEDLNLPKMDCIISIGTLQSSSLNFKVLFMNIIQNILKKEGSLILGFPNCRWIDSQIVFGAKPKNYTYSEQSILYNDVIFCKKYLQQKKFRVTLTGKNYLFLTATSIR